ncbi:MAG: FliH/SctL family protein [candidate division Zixibacteria bacterium]
MSKVLSIPLTDARVLIGEYSIDREAEEKAEMLLQKKYPGLMVMTSAEGKKQVPLQDIIQLDDKFRQEVKGAYSKGYEEGQKSGHERGQHEGLEEARQIVASLSGVLSDITNQRHQILADAKNKILELILKISQKLTFAAAEFDPQITMSIISGTIEQLLDKRNIKVKVHPGHLAELEQHIDKFMGSNTAIKEFNIEPDPRIRVGGCFIETPSGDIDARLESMYDVIKQALIDGEDSPE